MRVSGRCRCLSAGLAVGVALIAPRVGAAAPRALHAEVALRDSVALVMGGSGNPIPSLSDINAAAQFLAHAGYSDYTPNGLFTPEGLYPGTGVKSLPLDISVQQGLQILDAAIRGHLRDGDDVVVYGVSQSAVLGSLEAANLAGAADAPDPGRLAFLLIADEMNPNGGLLSRFALPEVPLSIPAMGIDFYGAAPADTPYATDIYAAEYDGFCDFPRYPINLISTLNAILGIAFVHGPGYFRDGAMDSAQLLPGSTHYDGPLPDGVSAAVNTDYYMIPTQILPLLQPLLSIPVLGQPLYDLLAPDIKILVDLGYGNLDTYVDGVLTDGGWDQGPANVPTYFGLFPENLDLGQLLTSLGQGARHGFDDFVDDLSHLAPWTASDAAGSVANFSLPSFSDVITAMSHAASTLYSVWQPTADIINALFTTLPAYDVSLFLNAFQGGDDLLTELVNALGNPVAADVGLASMAIGFELMTIANAFQSIAGDFSSLF